MFIEYLKLIFLSDQQNLDSTVSTNVTNNLDYETDELRAELAHFGDPPGN